MTNALGKHILVDYSFCENVELLNNVSLMEATLRSAAESANANVISVSAVAFAPQGVTAIAMLSESHISVHTWPEKKHAAIDIYTCGEHTKPYRAVEHIAAALKCDFYDYRSFSRGVEDNFNKGAFFIDDGCEA